MIVQKQGLRQLDWVILGSALLICVGGILAIKSARHLDLHPLDMVRKQAIGILLGSAAMIALAWSDYEVLLKRYARYLYPLNIVLLLAVLNNHFNHASHGASRWISLGPFQLQPSEFAKDHFDLHAGPVPVAAQRDHRRVAHSCLSRWRISAFPMLLIAKQPDLGTALVLAGDLAGHDGDGRRAGKRICSCCCWPAPFCLPGVWHFNPGHVLKDYQKNRLQVFLYPNADPRDTGYHLRQSEIAIGSGARSAGKATSAGTQSNGKFIPEQHTDFIFTVVGEEGGFVVCILLLALYLLLLERGVAVMADCEDTLGRLLAAGVLSLHDLSHCRQCRHDHGHHAGRGRPPAVLLLWPEQPAG